MERRPECVLLHNITVPEKVACFPSLNFSCVCGDLGACGLSLYAIPFTLCPCAVAELVRGQSMTVMYSARALERGALHARRQL